MFRTTCVCIWVCFPMIYPLHNPLCTRSGKFFLSSWFAYKTATIVISLNELFTCNILFSHIPALLTTLILNFVNFFFNHLTQLRVCGCWYKHVGFTPSFSKPIVLFLSPLVSHFWSVHFLATILRSGFVVHYFLNFLILKILTVI